MNVTAPSRSAKVDLDFADGTYPFRLAIGGLEELQEKTSAGPLTVLRRLMAGEWRIADVREPIRLGLIGGGMGALDARKMVDRYANTGDLLDAVPVAVGVVGAALRGVDDEKVGGTGEAETVKATTEAPTDASLSPGITETGS